MEEKSQELSQRIRSGKLTREDVARRLAELAFGKANDCVRLVMEDDPQLKKLDLSLLSSIPWTTAPSTPIPPRRTRS